MLTTETTISNDAEHDMLLIEKLDKLLNEIEKQIKERAYKHNGTDHNILQSETGVNNILALSILYETHDITL